MLCVDFQNLEGCLQEDRAKLFTVLHDERTKCSGHKMKQEMLKLHIRKHLFPMRTVRQWSRFPREVVLSLSLEIFNTWLDTVFSNLGWLQSCSCIQPEWVCDSGTGTCYFDRLQGSDSRLLCDSIFRFLEWTCSMFQTEVLKSLQHTLPGWSRDNSGASIQMSIAILNALGYLALSPAPTTEGLRYCLCHVCHQMSWIHQDV